MNAQERVLKAINHEEPDRVPAFELGISNNRIMKHCGFPPDESQMGLKFLKRYSFEDQNRFLKELIKRKEVLKGGYKTTYEFFRRANIDLVFSVTSLFPREILKFDDKKEGLGFVDEYGRIMRFERHQEGTFILEYKGGWFKSFEDYESWEPKDPAWEARLNSFEAGREIQEELNNEVFSIPSTAALMEDVWEGFGLEVFSRIMSKPKQAKKIFDDNGKFTLELTKILSENEAKLIILLDDYGYKNGLFMNPLNYQKYLFPWLKLVCKAAHKHDCKILLHSDGDLSLIFKNLISCGIDAIHPIEPTTANPEYDIFKLHQKYGDQITFVGNVNHILLGTGRISEIEDYSLKLIRELAPGGGYIFSSGHSITPEITPESWLAMQNTRLKYGNYPISLTI